MLGILHFVKTLILVYFDGLDGITYPIFLKKLQRSVYLLFFAHLFISSVYANSGVEKQKDFLFTENKGQWPEQVQYVVSLNNQQIFFEGSGIKIHEYQSICGSNHDGHWDQGHQHHALDPHRSYNHHVYKIEYGTRFKESQFRPLVKSSFYKNYIKGPDASAWNDHVYSYRELIIKNVYPKIDMHWYATDRGLKYDWIVHAGGNPQAIQITYKHLDGLLLDKQGDLFLHHSLGNTRESAPVAQQCIGGKGQKIDVEYILHQDKSLGLELGPYNHGEELIIDPELIFSSYSGSTGDNWGSTATPGRNGELYGGGIVFGTGYPVTTGAFQTAPGDPNALTTDIAISKFSSDGSNLIYSTYLGGRADELAHSLIENSRGELVVFGTSGSSGYPTTNDAVQRSFRGGPATGAPGVGYFSGCDMVITVLSADGSALVGSTYMGGSRTDGLNDGALKINYGDEAKGEVFLDKQDNIFIAASTRSSDFPVKNALFNNLAGNQDACIFSMNRSCSELIFSTYYGGQRDDMAYCIKQSENRDIIVGGGTQSRNLPDVNAYQDNYSGGFSDGFFLVLDSMATNIIAASYLGTNDYEQIYFNDLGPDGDIYFSGNTNGTLPQSSECYGRSDAGQFIQRFNQTGDVLKQSMGFGRGDELSDLALTAFLVDDCGRVFVSGWGGYLNDTIDLVSSTTFDLDVTGDAYERLTDGNDFYFMVLNPGMEELTYATFFGADVEREPADHVDGGTSRFSEDGVIYQAVCASCGGGDVFPTTTGAWSRDNRSNNCNLAVVKLDFELPIIDLEASNSFENLTCGQLTIDFLNASTGADMYTWYFGDGTQSNDYSPSHTYDSVGTYSVKMIAQSENDCVQNDTLFLDVNIDPGQETVYDTIIRCSSEPFSIGSSFENGNPFISYNWNTGDDSARIEVASSGVYAVTTTDRNCENIDSFYLEFSPPLGLSTDTSICLGDELSVSIPKEYNVLQWSNDSTSQEQSFSDTGIFWVSYEKSGCRFRDSFTVGNISQGDIQINGSNIICEGQTTILKTEVSNGGPNDQVIWSNGVRADSIEIQNSGVFSVLLNSNQPCFYTAADTVMVELVEDISQNKDIAVCDGDEAVLTGPPGAEEIEWFNDSKDTSISVSNSGQYFVNYTIDGCPMTDSFNVFIVDSTRYNFSLDGDSVICDEESVELRVDGLLGSEGVFDIEWSTGDSSNQITVSDSGLYQVRVTQSAPCPFEFEDEIALRQILPIDTIPDQKFCEGDSFSLNVPDYVDSVVWSDNSTSRERVLVESGIYGFEYQVEACVFGEEFELQFAEIPELFISADSIICNNESLELRVVGFSGREDLFDIEWSTGDSSNQITVSDSGLYQVRVTQSEPCLFEFEDEIGIQRVLPIDTIPDQKICEGDSFSLNVPDYVDSVVWNDNSTSADRIFIETGTYGFEYLIESCKFQEQFHIEIQARPDLRILGDSVVCNADMGRLEAVIQGDFDSEIRWSNNSTGPVIFPTNSGWYIAQVSLEGCKEVDSIKVEIIPETSMPKNIDTLLCGHERLIIDLRKEGTYSEVIWDDGYDGLIRPLQESGDFGYTLKNACENSYNTIQVQYLPFNKDEPALYIPNSFSPNNDGNNDLFKAQVPPDIPVIDFKLMIFDRWGNKLFSTRHIENAWDGRYKGKPLNTGVYVFFCQGEMLLCGEQTPFLFEGDLSLFR